MIVMMDDDSDDRGKKDDGMLEHKRKARPKYAAYLSFTDKRRRRRRRNIFHGLGSILPYPQKTNNLSISFVLPVLKKGRVDIFFFLFAYRVSM